VEYELAAALVAVAFGYGIWIGVNILRGRAWALRVAEALTWMDPGLAHMRSADRLGPRPLPGNPSPTRPSSNGPDDEERLAA
jgi:hypothetical protein